MLSGRCLSEPRGSRGGLAVLTTDEGELQKLGLLLDPAFDAGDPFTQLGPKVGKRVGLSFLLGLKPATEVEQGIELGEDFRIGGHRETPSLVNGLMIAHQPPRDESRRRSEKIRLSRERVVGTSSLPYEME